MCLIRSSCTLSLDGTKTLTGGGSKCEATSAWEEFSPEGSKVWSTSIRDIVLMTRCRLFISGSRVLAMVFDRSWLISGGSGGGDDGGGKDHRGWCTCCNMVASKKMKTDN